MLRDETAGRALCLGKEGTLLQLPLPQHLSNVPGPIFSLPDLQKTGSYFWGTIGTKSCYAGFSVKADGPNPFVCNFSTRNDKQIPLHFKRSFSECSFQANPYRLQ